LKGYVSMKVVVQRVKNASVSIAGKEISSIGKGYLLLVGFSQSDTLEEAEYLANKIAKLRVFPDEADKMNLSIKDIGGAVLSVSQFTLYADLKEGNRPSFTDCLDQTEAKVLYEKFLIMLGKSTGIIISNGVFGAMMEVKLTNDGPVTIILER